MEMNVLPLTTLALPHTRLLRGGDLGAVLIDACVADECIVLSEHSYVRRTKAIEYRGSRWLTLAHCARST